MGAIDVLRSWQRSIPWNHYFFLLEPPLLLPISDAALLFSPGEVFGSFITLLASLAFFEPAILRPSLRGLDAGWGKKICPGFHYSVKA